MLHIGVVYRLKAHENRTNLAYDMLQSFAECPRYCYFTEPNLYQEIDKNITKFVPDQ